MLAVHNLTCAYGDVVAARDISFNVAAGEITALVGANGAGKSSTLFSIMGLVPLARGSVAVDGVDITRVPSWERVHHGVAIVPEGRRVFAELSVDENLLVGGHSLARKQLRRNRQRAFDLFPRLGERRKQRAGSLSGGEQQMLAVARALLSEPRVLLIDELSLGLMPSVVDECYAVVRQLKADGVAVLLVDQNTERAVSTADQVCMMEAGTLVWHGEGEDPHLDEMIERFILTSGVATRGP